MDRFLIARITRAVKSFEEATQRLKFLKINNVIPEDYKLEKSDCSSIKRKMRKILRKIKF